MASATADVRPGLAPPAGETSVFDGPNPLANWNIVLQTVCIVIPSILLAIRCIVRLGIQQNRKSYQDLICFIAWALFIAYASLVAVLVSKGGGIHQWNVTHDQVATVLYWVNICQIVYSMSILAAKISVLILYLDLFAPARLTARWWTVVGIMIVNTLFYVALMWSKIWQCVPRDAIWDKDIKDAHCISLEALLDTSGSWNTVSDVCILVCPLLFIWKLKLDRRKRLGIIAFFAVGAIAPIFSLIGVVYRVEVNESPDLTYYQPRILFLAEAEVASGVICTALPSLPRFYKWITGHGMTTTAPSGDNKSTQYGGGAARRRGSKLRSRGDTELLGSQYLELDDHPAAGNVTRWADITASAPVEEDGAPESYSRNQIWKTTEIRVHSEPINGADASSIENSEDGIRVAAPMKALRR